MITNGLLSVKILSLISFSEPCETHGFETGGAYFGGSLYGSGGNINGGYIIKIQS